MTLADWAGAFAWATIWIMALGVVAMIVSAELEKADKNRGWTALASGWVVAVSGFAAVGAFIVAGTLAVLYAAGVGGGG